MPKSSDALVGQHNTERRMKTFHPQIRFNLASFYVAELTQRVCSTTKTQGGPGHCRHAAPWRRERGREEPAGTAASRAGGQQDLPAAPPLLPPVLLRSTEDAPQLPRAPGTRRGPLSAGSTPTPKPAPPSSPRAARPRPAPCPLRPRLPSHSGWGLERHPPPRHGSRPVPRRERRGRASRSQGCAGAGQHGVWALQPLAARRERARAGDGDDGCPLEPGWLAAEF